MMGILQIVLAITAMLIIVLATARYINNRLIVNRRLFGTGFILTCPKRQDMAFRDYTEARGYMDRAAKRGVRYRMYTVKNGRIERML